MLLNEADFQQIEDLLLRGRHLQAYSIAQPYGPLGAWPTIKERLLAAWLADNLGAGRQGSVLRLRAWRAAPQDPDVTVAFGWELLHRRGAFFAWEHFRNRPDLGPADVDTQVKWIALQARLACVYRDFDSAEQGLQRILALKPDNRWAAVERVFLLSAEDRFGAALAEARQVFQSRSDYPAAVSALAYMLGSFDRHEEAIEVLSAAAPRFECNVLWRDLALRQMELQRYEAAAESLERYAQTSPLLDKSEGRSLAATRSDLACLQGRRDEAIRLAEESKWPFFKTVAENLRQAAPGARRVLLSVPLVRQHHLTCGPATLTAIARFWSRPVEHIEVAEAICYDGTSHHDERPWVEQNGFLAREFTVTWDTTVALLDRGIPFTLTTVAPGSGHLQAVVGYDEARRTLLIRDPSCSYLQEYLGAEFLRDYRSGGPRGMVMIPTDKADLLAGLDLPDAALYDLYNQLSLALARHDRKAAEEAWLALKQRAADHRLTHSGRAALASYDGNNTELLQAIDQWLALYPGDPVLLGRKLLNLDPRTRRRERQAILEERCAGRTAHPYFLVEYGWFLNEDDRRQKEALAALRRAARRWPVNEEMLCCLGAISRTQRRFERSMEVFRLAACLSDKNESYAENFFRSARLLKRTAEVLAYLDSRFRRFGTKSGQPARTLFWAYEQLNQENKGFAILDEALERRPEDGLLLLYTANALARHGNYNRAEELLNRARDRVRPTAWLREAATLAGYRNQKDQALGFWRQVLEIDPCAREAHPEVARLLAEMQGRPTAIEHLRRAQQANPHDYAIHQLLIEWLREEGREEYVAAINRLIEVAPIDAWAHRELSIALRLQGKFEEAITAADLACHLDLAAPAGYDIRGDAELRAGRVEAARESYRQAIRQAVDRDSAIDSLLASYSTVQERREALAFVQQQLVEQVIFGDGLLAYRTHARGILDDEELLASLREALAARPDLWHAWSAVALHLLDMGRLDEAEQTARQAAERFPLVPRAWIELASVYRAKCDLVHEKEAVEKAIQINPNWGYAIRTLAEVHEKQGDFAASQQVLQRLVAVEPLDSANHGCLAQVLWKLGEKTAALDRVEQAARIDPYYGWAWARLREWAAELSCVERSIAAARDVARTRPGESNSWMLVARALRGADSLAERLEALDKAVARNSRNEYAYDLRAAILSEAGRTDEALAACSPAVWGDHPPALLRLRAARLLSAHSRTDEAITRLKALVAEDPLNSSAWECLADIYSDANRHAEHLEAATQLHRLQPTSTVSQAHLGWALERNDRKAEAKTYFRQAFDLDPAYSFAGIELFDLFFDDGQTEEARKVLAVLKAHSPGPYVTAREVQLAARDGDFKVARRGFVELGSRADGADWPLDAAAKALADKGQTGLLDEAIRQEILGQPKFHPNIGCLWLRHVGPARSMRRQVRFVDQMMAKGEVGARAAFDLLAALGKGDHRRRLLRFLRRHRVALQTQTRLWGQAGYALSMRRAFRPMDDWFVDYKNRKDAQPWMIFNLVYALQSLRRDREADEAARHALTLAAESATPSHQAIVAFYQALRGETAEAAKRLEGIDTRSFSQYDLHLLELARALAAAGSGSPDGAGHEAAVKHLTAARREHPSGDPAARRLFRLTVRRMARLRGGWRGLVWYLRAPGPCPRAQTPHGFNLGLYVAVVGIIAGGILLGPLAIFMGLKARDKAQAADPKRSWGLPEVTIVLGILAILSFIVQAAVRAKPPHP